MGGLESHALETDHLRPPPLEREFGDKSNYSSHLFDMLPVLGHALLARIF